MKIITKKEALEKNLIFYFTGKPCKHGHLSERMVKGGSCRVCKNLFGEKQRNKNREEYNKYCREKKKELYSKQKRRESYIQNNAKEMFYAAKHRAKIKKLDFTITLDDVIIPDKCPIFGIDLNFNNKNNIPSLDRVVNHLGYIKGNVQVISLKANRLKNNATLEELKKIIQYMENIEFKP